MLCRWTVGKWLKPSGQMIPSDTKDAESGEGEGESFLPYNDGEVLHLANSKIELLGNRVDLSAV